MEELRKLAIELAEKCYGEKTFIAHELLWGERLAEALREAKEEHDATVARINGIKP